MPKQRFQDPKIHQNEDGSYFIRPWVDFITADGKRRSKKTFNLGKSRRDAVAKKNEIMRTVNSAVDLIKSQIRFEDLVEEYLVRFVRKEDNLAASTRGKYECHLKNHIRPAFKDLTLCELTPLLIEGWLQKKAEAGMSWATRTDLRNILSGMFKQAKKWGYWDRKEENPVAQVSTGKKKAKYTKRKLTDDETRLLLAALPRDVQFLCLTALVSTMRISELLGLKEKHLNFDKELIEVRMRYYRGDVDTTKTERSKRDIPMGYLLTGLRDLCLGDPERFVFNITTHPGRKHRDGSCARPRVCRDDRDIHQHFLRPAATQLKLHFKGFGFHSLRREAITNISREAGIEQASLMAGHTKLDMTMLYELADLTQQRRGAEAYYERLMGTPLTDVKQ